MDHASRLGVLVDHCHGRAGERGIFCDRERGFIFIDHIEVLPIEYGRLKFKSTHITRLDWILEALNGEGHLSAGFDRCEDSLLHYEAVVLEAAAQVRVQDSDRLAGLCPLDVGLLTGRDWVLRIPLGEINKDVAVSWQIMLLAELHPERC